MNKSTEKVSDFVKTSSIGSKKEHYSSGFYIPPEGTEEFEKFLAAIDKEYEQLSHDLKELKSKSSRK